MASRCSLLGTSEERKRKGNGSYTSFTGRTMNTKVKAWEIPSCHFDFLSLVRI